MRDLLNQAKRTAESLSVREAFNKQFDHYYETFTEQLRVLREDHKQTEGLIPITSDTIELVGYTRALRNFKSTKFYAEGFVGGNRSGLSGDVPGKDIAVCIKVQQKRKDMDPALLTELYLFKPKDKKIRKITYNPVDGVVIKELNPFKGSHRVTFQRLELVAEQFSRYITDSELAR